MGKSLTKVQTSFFGKHIFLLHPRTNKTVLVLGVIVGYCYPKVVEIFIDDTNCIQANIHLFSYLYSVLNSMYSYCGYDPGSS